LLLPVNPKADPTAGSASAAPSPSWLHDRVPKRSTRQAIKPHAKSIRRRLGQGSSWVSRCTCALLLCEAIPNQNLFHNASTRIRTNTHLHTQFQAFYMVW
jgi:hypothetical protein